MDRVDEVGPYERILDYGRAPAARRVTWHITAGDRTVRRPPMLMRSRAPQPPLVAFLRRAWELMCERRLHLPPERTPKVPGLPREVPEVVLTDPVHRARRPARFGLRIARDGGKSDSHNRRRDDAPDSAIRRDEHPSSVTRCSSRCAPLDARYPPNLGGGVIEVKRSGDPPDLAYMGRSPRRTSWLAARGVTARPCAPGTSSSPGCHLGGRGGGS